MSDEASTEPTLPEVIVTATPLPSSSALTLNQIWGNIIKPFTAIAPTDSRFVDATISLDEIGKGYTLDYNPNGILWRVNAAGKPHPDDLEKFYEQQEIIQGYSDNLAAELKSNINLDKIGEYLDAYDFATNQLVSGPPPVAAAGALLKFGVKGAKGVIKVGKYIACVDEAADIAKGSSNAVKVSAERIIESANVANRGGETIVGHALQKHAGRNPEIWGKIRGGPEEINQSALKHLKDIMEAPGDFIEVTNERGIQFLEKKLPDGRGVRLNLDGTFKGFLDQ